jgi:hypothetical protein
MSFSRREFVRIVPALGAFTVSADVGMAQEPGAYTWPAAPPADGAPQDESFPSQHAFLTREVVAVSHGNLARLKELVLRRPSLAKASWDWGFGDWETALGGASHVGNRPIAEFLLENGAAPTIFSSAMLGEFDVVKAYAAAQPDIHLLRGPHGIPLAAHARAGGPAALPVLEFLQSLGKPLSWGDQEPLTDNDRRVLEGQYVFGSRPRDLFMVDTEQNRLGIRRAGAARRILVHLGNLEFHPVGAQAARIKFQTSQTAVTLTLFDPDFFLSAPKSYIVPKIRSRQGLGFP